MRRIFQILALLISVAALGYLAYDTFFHDPAGDIEVRLVLQDNKFDKAEIRVPAKRPIVLIVKNNDAMPEEVECLALRVERIVGPHAEAKLRLRPLNPGRYEFIGEYKRLAKTVLIVE